MIRALALALGMAIGGGLVVACDSMETKRHNWHDCKHAPCTIEWGMR
jgi:hypothetical protein